MRFMMIVVVALGALVLPGCFRYHAARGEAGAARPISTDAWVVPEETEALRTLRDETPESYTTAEIDREVMQRNQPHLTESNLDLIEAAMDVSINASRIEHGGLVRFWGNNDYSIKHSSTLGSGLFSMKLEHFTGDGSYLSAPELEWLNARDAIGKDDSFDQLTEYFSSYLGIKRTYEDEALKLKEGIRLGLPDPAVDDEPERVGTVLHIASFYENKYEHQLLDRLEGYGWGIAHLDPEITLREPNAIELHAYLTKSRAIRQEWLAQDPEYQRLRASRAIYSKEDRHLLRQRYQASRDVSANQLVRPKTGFEVFPDTDLQAHGQMIARMVDERIAEHAYAAQALIEESDRIDPELADKPIVVFGFSAGALVAPAVVTRLHEAYPDRAIALIMLGGGGDVLSASLRSVFEEAKINFTPRDGPKPTQAQLDELVTHYRAASKLDPLTLAPVIRDLPTLHLYAARDTVVPTSSARAFNEAHGHVDRLVHPLNHETLFYFAAGEAGRIKSWLREHGMMD